MYLHDISAEVFRVTIRGGPTIGIARIAAGLSMIWSRSGGHVIRAVLNEGGAMHVRGLD